MSHVNAWDWEDKFLLVGINNRNGTYRYALDHVSQVEFFEHIRDHLGDGNEFMIYGVEEVLEDAFEVFRDVFAKRGFLVEGDTT